ncbi:hypothetical protein GCM10010869_24100 [Mesorhizobium tianshanense]|nr:hypothetical protein GCM10010869_24100 [Mesorhizobium tianshanense]
MHVWRVHPEGVPPLGAPRLADAASFQYLMTEASLFQCVADAKPCPTGTDYDGIKDVDLVRQRRLSADS